MDAGRASPRRPPPPGRQVTIRYFGLYANAHRGKVRKSEQARSKLFIIEQECSRIPRRGWAEMIRKVYEVNPLICPQCGGKMKIIAFLTDYAVVDRIINHLKLTFVAAEAPSASDCLSRALDGR